MKHPRIELVYEHVFNHHSEADKEDSAVDLYSLDLLRLLVFGWQRRGNGVRLAGVPVTQCNRDGYKPD